MRVVLCADAIQRRDVHFRFVQPLSNSGGGINSSGSS